MSAIKCYLEDELYRLHDKGLSIEEIAEKLGVDFEFVNAYLGEIDEEKEEN